MREFKFRFWDKILKSMNYRNPLTYDFAHKEIIPQQFTGLKDKNGTEIYEGDIIKDTQGIAFVRWYSDRWMLESPGSQAVDEMTPNGWVTCEVIGNIYENPELLSGSEV